MDYSSIAALPPEARRLILERHRAQGVCIPCEDGVLLAEDVEIAAGTLVLPGVILLQGTVVAADCVLGGGCVLHRTQVAARVQLQHVHAEDAVIGAGCELGPFVRLRAGTVLGEDIKIGNFVEIKNSQIGDGTKVAHLSYIGDAQFGRGINVGCGLAVANYDGAKKHQTLVGDGAFIGCHNSLVAPVELGAGAFTAAGSVITQNVPAGGFAIARARQQTKERTPKEE